MLNLKNKLKELGLTTEADPRVSNEEGYFYDWLLELKGLGYIHDITLQPKFPLTEAISLDFKREEMKGRGKNRKLEVVNKEYSVMKGMHYTPDFNVIWNESARGKFVFCQGDVIEDSFTKVRQRMFLGHEIDWPTSMYLKKNPFHNGSRLCNINFNECEGKVFTCIEVKGSFTSKNNSTDVKFPLLMKMVYDSLGIYVNKCMPLHKTKGTFANTFTPKSYWCTAKTKKERKLAWTRLSIDQYLNLIEPEDSSSNDQLNLEFDSN